MRWVLIIFLGFNIVNLSLKVVTEYANPYKTVAEIILLAFFLWGLIINVQDRNKPLSGSIVKQRAFFVLMVLAMIFYLYSTYNYYKAKNELGRNSSLKQSILITILTTHLPK